MILLTSLDLSEYDLFLGNLSEICTGKLELVNCVPDDLPDIALAMQLRFISPGAAEAASFHRLPKLAHKDPFDRMLVWQAIHQELCLISKDHRLVDYQSFGLQVIW